MKLFLGMKFTSIRRMQLWVLYQFMKLSVFLFKKNKQIKEDVLIGIVHVNSLGDSLNYYACLKLQAIKEKKKVLVITPNVFPSLEIIPILFSDNEYIVYDHFIYRYIRKLIPIKYRKSSIDFMLGFAIRKMFGEQVLITFNQNIGKENNKIFKNNSSFISKKYCEFNQLINIATCYSMSNNIFNLLLFLFQYFELVENDTIHRIFLNQFQKKYIDDIKPLKNILGINRKYVCLHIKEYYEDDSNSYHTRGIKDRFSYIESIKFLIKSGYDVVKMGSIDRDQDLKFKDTSFINYSTSGYQSILNDMILIKNCNFYIGSGTGPVSYPMMFKKPLMYINIVSANTSVPLYREIRYFPKLLRDQKSGKLLDAISLLDSIESINPCYRTYEELNSTIEFVDLTSAQILESTKEMIEFIGNENTNPSNLQLKFKQALNPNHQMPYFSDALPFNSFLKHIGINNDIDNMENI